MLSNKPYLIRAFYQWILDNQCTPFLIISTNYPQSHIPEELIDEGQITLNISPDAVRDLDLGNQHIKLRASFSGMTRIIAAPVKAVLAIYAQENGQGMFFETEDTSDTLPNLLTPLSVPMEETFSPLATTTKKTTQEEKKGTPPYLKLVD